MVHQFKEIADYIKTANLAVAPKYLDFLIYDWEDINYDECTSDLPYRNHYFEIVLELESNCKFTVDQFNFTSVSGENNLFFISPYRLQSCESGTGSGSYKGFTILFKPEFIHMAPSNANFLQDFPFFDHLNSPGITLEPADLGGIIDIFYKIKQEYSLYSVYSREIIKNYLNILLLKGKKHYHQQAYPAANRSRDQEIYNTFMSLVQQHYLRLNAVSDYADRLHISPKHLSETVKKVSGKGALQVIHDAQLHHAKSLLRQTSMTVSQIAYELQFDNPDYFSVFFKRLAGESPLAFRNS